MQSEFYRSQTDLVPTFSLLLAVSLVGLNAATPPSPATVETATSASPPCGLVRYSYYGSPERTLGAAEQADSLRRFAENLLALSEDSPQIAVDLLNRHFWDLV
jgi:hypothetical protein